MINQFIFRLLAFTSVFLCLTPFGSATDAVAKILNSGWPKAFAGLENHMDFNKDYVMIKVIPPRWPYDLRNIEQFRRSSIAHFPLYKEGVGHTIVSWHCHAFNPQRTLKRGSAAVTGGHDGQISDMMRNGWGLTAMVSLSNDGFMQLSEEIDEVLNTKSYAELGSYNLLMEVSQEECNRTYKFVWDFGSHPSYPMSRFGLAADPNKFEGAGCGSFAWTAFSRSEALPPHATNLVWRELKAPVEWMGRNLPNLPDTAIVFPFQTKEGRSMKPHKVPFNDLMSRPWYGTSGVYEKLEIVDPELMIFTIQHLTQLHYQSENSRFESDYRVIWSLVGNVYEYLSIDAKFDARTSKIASAYSQWWWLQRERGLKSEIVKFGDSTALLLHRN